MKTTTFFKTVAAALLGTALPFAHALDLQPHSFSLQAGIGKGHAVMAGAGIIWDWDFERLRRHAQLSAHTELMVNEWRYPALGGGHDTLTQLVLLPTLRMQLAQGRSPWYIELGVGPSWTSRRMVTPDKAFSTQWNFYDVLGAGYRFGLRGEQELGVRLNHTSNGGLRKPNPGQDFLQLRYVARF